MSNPLLDQFQSWIKQLENVPDASFTEQLAQWQHWVRQFQQNAEEISPNHAELVDQLSVYSGELVELLAQLTRARAQGADPSEQLQQLRAELHKFNLRHILEHATLAHQFLDLLFTQQGSAPIYSAEQRQQLQAMLQQFKHPRFTNIRSLLEAMLGWHEAISTLNTQLDKVSAVAIEQFCAAADESLEHEQLLSLWVSSYDQAYRSAFNQQDLQQAQAQLVNSLVQLQICLQRLIDQFAEQLGLPSRNQIDLLIAEFDQQRRRIRKLEQELEQLKAIQSE